VQLTLVNETASTTQIDATTGEVDADSEFAGLTDEISDKEMDKPNEPITPAANIGGSGRFATEEKCRFVRADERLFRLRYRLSIRGAGRERG
jgi:hypothetical protein